MSKEEEVPYRVVCEDCGLDEEKSSRSNAILAASIHNQEVYHPNSLGATWRPVK